MSVNVTGTTEIAGIFGHPVKHSLSPRMHNAAFKELGLDMIYLAFEVPQGLLKESMEAVRMLNFVGVNLTHPHKVSALDHLDEIEDGARRIGAVNTVVNNGGTLIGHNTDGAGFVQSLKLDYHFDPGDKQIVVFGAGGAGRAICSALSRENPGRLVIVEKIFERAQEITAAVSGVAVRTDDASLAGEISRADLVVNATTGEVELINLLQQRGGRAGDGCSMLLHQGALAFELWTGKKAPLETMRRALRSANQIGYQINNPLEG